MKIYDHIDLDKLYYLASPYSHKDPEVQRQRLEAAARIGAKLHLENVMAIHPITQSVKLVESGVDDGDFAAWARLDLKYIEIIDGGVIVAMLPGWEQSKGVAAEIKFAHSIGKEVYFITEELDVIDPRTLVINDTEA